MNPEWYSHDELVHDIVDWLLHTVDDAVTEDVIHDLQLCGFGKGPREPELPAVPCEDVERMITEAQAFANNAGNGGLS